MIQILKTVRFAATLALASLGGTSSFAAQPDGSDEAENAADAAQQIAIEAENAIRSVDPTTGQASLAVDSTPARSDGVEVVPIEVLVPVDQPGVSTQIATPPRGPAARTISGPVVQALPAPDPVVPPATPAARTAQASNDPFTIKSIMSIPDGPFRYGDWYWDEAAAPAKGKLVVTVDLEARVISAFRDGHEIGTAVALLGTKKHPTPLGSFPILTKEKDNISEKYDNAPMPWTLRLTWDGIAIHGSPVINGYASHGCVGVPEEFAAKLFAAARRGDRVLITRGKMVGVGDKIS